MEVDDVYYCPGINGLILLTGRLLTSGWQLWHEGTEAWLTNPNGNSFYLDFKNFCWTIKVQHNAMISKVSQQPSYDPYLWHVRLGHVSKSVVQRFLKVNMPEIRLDNKSFFCKQCARSKTLDLKSNGVASDLPRKNPLNRCMTDVAGTFNMDINGCRFLITMRDHASTYTFCDVMAGRSKVPDTTYPTIYPVRDTE
jgi:hypothetical protein